jgi:hypothetical protein
MSKKSLKLADLKLENVIEGGNKNIEAIANANRAIIDGYTDLAKRQYDMLKDFIDEIKGMAGEKGQLKDQLKEVLDLAKDDVVALQKMANKTNAQAQKILKKRTEANVKAWKDLLDDARAKIMKEDQEEAPKSAAKPAAKPAKKKAAKKKAAKKK